jgi:hypothetical protein
MSLRNRPTDHAGTDPSTVSLPKRAVELLRTHAETWGRRYVDMRVDARTGTRDED